jgi:hypothetical protein
VKYTPFNTVEVLDNRVDTVCLYALQDGTFPPKVLQLGGTTSGEIREQLQKEINVIPHKSDTLLINLLQCKVVNKYNLLQKDERGTHQLRRCILLWADLYRKRTDGLYYPIVMIKKVYPVRGDLSLTLSRALKEMLRMAGNIPLKDVPDFQYPKDTKGYTLPQINIPEKKHWMNYPIIAQEALPNGVYMFFSDFRSGVPAINTLHLQYNAKDSVYLLSNAEKKWHDFPWGIVDSGVLYINIFSNIYVKSWFCHYTYCFYVPYSLPDMYTLLSIQPGIYGNSASNANTSGNLLVGLTAEAIQASIDALFSNAILKRIKKQGMLSGFRFCYVDMDSGDIIYSQSMPNL